MTTPEEGLKAQVRNIEATYGKSMAEWTELVRVSGLSKHGDIIAILKRDHGMSHGNANRVALVVRDALAGGAPGAHDDAVATMYEGKKTALLPIHEALVARVCSFGDDVEASRKRAYVSLRRRKQFAMIQPGAGRVDVGLVLRDTDPTDRLEPSGSFNAMFTHRVRVDSLEAIDDELLGWLRRAYDTAG